MARKEKKAVVSSRALTGISGFDEITGGGLPRRRVTVVFGGAGSGKTIFALQSLVSGVTQGEPGILVAFEESAEEIRSNAAAFGWNVPGLERKGLTFFDAQLSTSVLDGGEFDLVGLLAMLGAKAKQLGAKRIAFDGIDVLLSHLGDPSQVRREVFRLRDWLRQSGATGVITSKTDEGRPSPEYAFLQFMSDCVVSLQHRVVSSTAYRTIRVAKYRGNGPSTNEFPFTITRAGIEVATATSVELDYPTSSERVSTGVKRLDAMLRGGYHRGSSILVSGAPGTAKTSLAAAFADAACRRKERTLYVSFDEAPGQIVRNVESIGLRFGGHLKSGLLGMCSLRTRSGSPESHVARVRQLIREHRPRNLIVDPLSALAQIAPDDALATQAALQILELAKEGGITFFSTSLLSSAASLAEETPFGMSTIADTWMHVSYVIQGGERNRGLTIIKSRGTGHSSQVRELILSDAGITLADVYAAGGEVLMGTLRWEKENERRREGELAQLHSDIRQRQAELVLVETRARAQGIRGEQELREAELRQILAERKLAVARFASEGSERSERRGGDRVPTRRAPTRRGTVAS